MGRTKIQKSDVHVGALVRSEDGGRTTDSRVASGDEPDLSFKLAGALVKASIGKDVVKRLVCAWEKESYQNSDLEEGSDPYRSFEPLCSLRLKMSTHRA